MGLSAGRVLLLVSLASAVLIGCSRDRTEFADASLIASEVGACPDGGCVDGPLDESITPRATAINTDSLQFDEVMSKWGYDVDLLQGRSDTVVLIVSGSQTNDCRLEIENVRRNRSGRVDVTASLSSDTCDLGSVGISFLFAMNDNTAVTEVLFVDLPATLAHN